VPYESIKFLEDYDQKGSYYPFRNKRGTMNAHGPLIPAAGFEPATFRDQLSVFHSQQELLCQTLSTAEHSATAP